MNARAILASSVTFLAFAFDVAEVAFKVAAWS